MAMMRVVTVAMIMMVRVEHLDWSGLEADGGGGKELLVQGEVLGG